MIYRIDDIGASSKRFSQRAKYSWANLWFLKKIPPFRKAGPYKELTVKEWQAVLRVFGEFGIAPIVSVTATWVDKRSRLVPFPKKFPEEASFLRQALKSGDVRIANHGLTHCLVGEHLPHWRKSNRRAHREFYPELSQAIHDEHVLESQRILETYFGEPIETFVPPGNVWSVKTYQALRQTNVKQVISYNYMADSKELMQGIEYISDREGFCAFHDKELKRYGVTWLRNKIKECGI